MMGNKSILAAATLAGLFVAGAAVAMVDEGHVLITIDRPGFTAPPPEKLGYFMPERSARLKVSGRALLSCAVSPEGKLAGCETVSAAPAGWEFNLAAERLAQKAPIQVAQPPSGGRIYVPLVFKSFDAPIPDRAELLVDQPIRLTPSPAGKTPCPTQDSPRQTCTALAGAWAGKASLEQMAAILAAGAPTDGVTQAHCRQEAAGGLADCELRGLSTGAAAAAMDRILSVYRPDFGAKDEGAGEVLLTVDWARLPKVIAAFED